MRRSGQETRGIRSAWLGISLAALIAGCSDGSRVQVGGDTGGDSGIDVTFATRDTQAPIETTAETTSAETHATNTAETNDDTGPEDTTAPLDTSPADISKPSDVADTGVAPETEADTAETETEVLPTGGEDCADPTLLTDPDHDDHYDVFADVGALSHLHDDYDALACGITDTTLNGHAKADAVWRFVAPSDGAYRVSLLSDTNIDLILYVFDDAACGTTCLGFDDSGAAADIDSLTLTLTKDQAIAVVVDGKAAWHAGAYVVDVYACGATCD